jgi:hypothetical protein
MDRQPLPCCSVRYSKREAGGSQREQSSNGRPQQTDAATLDTIVTLTSGQYRTSTRGFPSAAQCERASKLLRMLAPLSSKAQIYCVKHERADHANVNADLLDGSDEWAATLRRA